MIDATQTAGTVAPVYPVIIWGHDMRGGDCAASGYLYSGSVAALRGKFIYHDLTTGASGIRITPTCWRQTTEIRRRWRTCTR